MKRIILVALAIVMLITTLVACNKEKNVYDIDKSYDSRTAAFYGHIQENQFFWFDMYLTQDKLTYRFTQATNGKNVTTILDYEDNSKDSYEIVIKGENQAVVHNLNLAEKKYDTTMTDKYQDFLFGGEDPKAFENPTWSGDATFEGQTYYCEKFEVASASGSAVDGYNNYYFEEGRLIAVEIIQKDKVTMLMKFNEYGIELPDDIYITPPTDFKKGIFQIESVIDYTSMGWGE